MSNFDDYFDLYEKGAYREAYAVLRDIMKSQPRWSKVGNMYIWCADLELLVNNDVHRARQLLDKAHELGCSDMSFYYNILGYILWTTGEHDRGGKRGQAFDFVVDLYFLAIGINMDSHDSSALSGMIESPLCSCRLQRWTMFIFPPALLLIDYFRLTIDYYSAVFVAN